MSSKYAALPDLDSSQDIYETPDLADDVSTLPTSTGAPTETDDDAPSNEAIDHAHLKPGTARGRFRHTEIDATDVDFSDRITGKRKSYRATSRRRRQRAGFDEYEEGDDDEDDEFYGEDTIARKLARLKREVEELKNAVAEKEEGNEEGEGEGEGSEEKAKEEVDVEGAKRGIAELGAVLEKLTVTDEEQRGAQARLAKRLATSAAGAMETKVAKKERSSPEEENGQDASTYTVTYAPAYKTNHTLARIADYDTRLSILEKVLGMSTSAIVDSEQQLPSNAMIPTLNELSRQMGILNTSSTASLDNASRRVKQLTLETEKLAEARKAAKLAALEGGTDPLETEETVSKINALYGTLPNIENLGGMLPAVLDRLRTLRVIHQDAGKAVDRLKTVEQRQEEMGQEIARWEDALGKVEGLLKESKETIGGNMEKVEEWVKEIEEKMKRYEVEE